MRRVTWRDAVWAGDTLNVAGQLATVEDPDGLPVLVAGDGKTRESLVVAQTRLVLKKIVGILEANGLTPADVVKTTCYLVKMDDYHAFNEEYAKVFPTDPPARQTMAVHELWNGAVVEIDCWAYRKNRG